MSTTQSDLSLVHRADGPGARSAAVPAARASSLTPSVRVQTMGRFAVTIDGVPVDCWRGGRARVLLQYLLLRRDQLVPREVLMEAFWPDADPRCSATSLKVAIHALRRVLALPQPDGCAAGSGSQIAIHSHPLGYRLDTADAWIDFEAFQACIDGARAMEAQEDEDRALACYLDAVQLYTGEFLPGEEVLWIVEQREWLRDLSLQALRCLAQAAMRQRDYVGALAWCRRTLEIDPCCEAAYRALMVCHARLGQLCRVKDWYEICRRKLHAEFGIEPERGTTALFASLLRNRRLTDSHAWMAMPRAAPVGTEAAEPMFDALDLSALRRRRSEKWQRYPADVIPAFIAEMDFPVAPAVLEAIREPLRGAGDLGYAFAFTFASPMHSGFASWAAATFGWSVPPDRVMLFPDVMRVVEVSLDALTEPDGAVVIDIPAYPPFMDAVAGSGRPLVKNPMLRRDRRWQIDLVGLERRFADGAAAYVLCNPHNPTGRVLTTTELRHIAGLALRHDVLVISDEVFAPLVYDGRRHVPLAALPEAAKLRLVTAMSATKAWNIAGLKCGFGIAGSDEVFHALASTSPRKRDGVGILGIQASLAAFASGEQWLAQTLRYLDGNRRLLASLLADALPQVGYDVPDGTYLAWLDCRRLAERLATDDIRGLVLDRGRVALSDGSDYGCDGFLRLNFATSRLILIEMIRRMSFAVSGGVTGNHTRGAGGGWSAAIQS